MHSRGGFDPDDFFDRNAVSGERGDGSGDGGGSNREAFLHGSVTGEDLGEPCSHERGRLVGRLSEGEQLIFLQIGHLNRRIGFLQETVMRLLERTPLHNESETRRNIRRVHLDRFCLPVLEVNPEPTGAQLHSIGREMEEAYPGHEPSLLLSLIRRWFRKRREELSLKTINSFRRLYDLTPEDFIGRSQIIESLREGSFDLSRVVEGAELPLIDRECAERFCRKKILSYLSRA